MKSILTLVTAVSLGAVLGTGAFAATVDPSVGTFGDLQDATENPVTFGGDGIPTNPSNYATYEDGLGNTLVLGLAITPRFGNAVPTSTVDGIYNVAPGLDAENGDRTRWNFSWYAEIFRFDENSPTISEVGLEILYDLDSSAGTQISDLGIINAAFFPNSTPSVAENSQNITFGYLETGIPLFNTPPTTVDIDADNGEYSFLIRATNFGGGADAGVGVIAIAEDDTVATPIPLPAGLPLILAGLGGFALLRRRQRS